MVDVVECGGAMESVEGKRWKWAEFVELKILCNATKSGEREAAQELSKMSDDDDLTSLRADTQFSFVGFLISPFFSFWLSFVSFF